MKVLFPLLILLSVFSGILTGNMKAVSEAAMKSALEAVDLTFSLTGTICLWSGMMEAADAAGITACLNMFFSPLLRLIFGKRLSAKAARAMSANLSANLMGLGNAATPLGLAAMAEMQKTNTGPSERASDQMVLFAVMNTASLQLIPATLMGLRTACGSTAPAEILPAVWIVSAVTFTAGILAAKFFGRFFR